MKALVITQVNILTGIWCLSAESTTWFYFFIATKHTALSFFNMLM